MITSPGSPPFPPLLLSFLPPLFPLPSSLPSLPSLLPSPPLPSPPSPTGGKGSMSSQCLCTACAETPEEGVIITLHNYRCCVGSQTKHSQDHSHGCALGTSFQKVVDMNCIPSTNSAHHSRELSTNMLTLHSSAYATPVVVQCNHDSPPPPPREVSAQATHRHCTQALYLSPSSQKQSGYVRPVTM